jgi:hypothetical protein
MPTQVKKFAGVLNTDDPVDVINPFHHIDAKNGRFTGSVNDLRFENIEGTVFFDNTALPSMGNNLCIGRHYDEVKNRTFYFNYNDAGQHGIYILNADNTFTTVLANTLLAFNADTPITSIDILYNNENDGDLLYFIDSLKRPTKLNIQRYIANTYSPVKRAFIDVIKAPPTMPVKAFYENDFNVTINNLKNSLFEFIYRFVYDDFDKSVWSSGSITPLPYEPFDQTIDNNRFYNARIALYFQTGDVNVRKIEIAFKQKNQVGDYYLIQSFDKSALSIPSNTLFRFAFYNDGQYSPIDVKEQVLLFDYVPQEANAQALLNGNVPSYGGIKEGYDLITPNITTQSSASGYIFNLNGVGLFAYQGNSDSIGVGNDITIVCTGVGTNNGSGEVISLDNFKFTFTLNAVDSGGGNRSFTYTNTATSSISAIFAAILAVATTAGYTLVSQTTNTITIRFVGISLYISTVYYQRSAGDVTNTYNAAVYADKFSSAVDYGVIYYDAAGRTNSVITSASCAVNTATAQTGDATFYPLSIININHRPPLWAAYYHVVKSNNLTYQKSLDWVSKQAFADAATISTQRYAYIDVSNISTYNIDLGAENNALTSGNVAYEYQVGDRIRFIKRFPLTGSAVPLNTRQYDYEIVGVTYTQNINGVVQSGVFLKIKYPTADISSDFGFTGSDYQNYQIFIYAYALHTTLNSTLFYEIGHRRGIGNAGTNSAFHICNNQIQPSNLSSSGIEYITEGNGFSRFRTVPAGNTYQITFGGGDVFTYNLSTFKTSPNPVIDITGQYSIHEQQSNLNSGLLVSEYPTIADNNYFFYNESATVAKQIRIRTQISQYSDGGSYFQLYAKLSFTGQTIPSNLLIIDDQAINTTGTPKVYDVDITINVPPLNKVFLLTAGSLGVNKVVVGSNLRLDVLRPIQIPIIDKSFSDLINIDLTSYSRAVSVVENARQEYKPTLFRFAEPLQQGTDINLSNRFYPNNTDEFDRQWGEVVRMVVNGRKLEIFQYANTGVVGIYTKFIKDNSGSNNLITTDTIITPNNIQYYSGGFGIRNQPTGLCKNGYVYYFPDTIRGVLCRLSQDGVTPISETGKVQTWAGVNIASYQTDSNYQFGGKARILAVYNQLKNRHGEVLFVLQRGTNGTTVTKEGYTIAYDEQRNAFSAFYDFNPDQIVCAANTLVSFRNGKAYKHTDTANTCNFYGTQYNAYIEAVFNQFLLEKKTWEAITEISNKCWECSSIYTNVNSYELPAPQRQESELKKVDFKRLENDWHAVFLRDIHSVKGLLRGDFLKGNFIVIKFQSEDSSTFSSLSQISAKYIDSPLTER